MRLIDADEVLKTIKMVTDPTVATDVLDHIIATTPTSYDLDKVLVRISEFAECNDECANNFYYGMGCGACMWSEVFAIVKRGGVDEID